MSDNRNIGLEERQEQEMNAATLAEYLEAGHITQHNADLAAKYLREQAAELERERMRLAACGVVAMANTTDSAARAREMHDDYRSASCDGVAKAVDREMAMRAENAKLREALLDATAHLADAASAYRTYAKHAPHLGKVPADALFTTRADDFDRAVERARAALE